MKGREIREDQRVARYVRPRLVHSTGHADPEAFVLRTSDDGTPEDGLSVNWLDAFPGGTRSQLKEVTRCLRLKVTRNGRFAEFVVGGLTAVSGCVKPRIFGEQRSLLPATHVSGDDSERRVGF